MEIKNIVKDNKVYFLYATEGYLYYGVKVEDKWYQFPVPFADTNEVGNATFLNEDKAIIFMRYIRKAIENDNFMLTNKAGSAVKED